MDIYAVNNVSKIEQDLDLSVLGWTDAGAVNFGFEKGTKKGEDKIIFILPITFDLLDYDAELLSSGLFLNDILNLVVENSDKIIEDYRSRLDEKIKENVSKSLNSKKDKIAFELESNYGDVNIKTTLEIKSSTPIMTHSMTIKYKVFSE